MLNMHCCFPSPMSSGCVTQTSQFLSSESSLMHRVTLAAHKHDEQSTIRKMTSSLSPFAFGFLPLPGLVTSLPGFSRLQHPVYLGTG